MWYFVSNNVLTILRIPNYILWTQIYIVQLLFVRKPNKLVEDRRSDCGFGSILRRSNFIAENFSLIYANHIPCNIRESYRTQRANIYIPLYTMADETHASHCALWVIPIIIMLSAYYINTLLILGPTCAIDVIIRCLIACAHEEAHGYKYTLYYLSMSADSSWKTQEQILKRSLTYSWICREAEPAHWIAPSKRVA